MTDRLAGFLITLDGDYRVDDGGKQILDAIRMIKGVGSVEPVPADHALHMAVQRARAELREKIWEVLSS